MNNLGNLTDSDREQIKELADDIAQLLSLDRPEAIEYLCLIGEEFLKERFRWFAIGMHIWTTLSNISDPIQNLDFDKNLKSQIRVDSIYYLALATVAFQAEDFIKTEAQRQKIEYPFSNRIKLVYALIKEDCIDRLRLRVPQHEWVSPSGQQFRDRARTSKKWLSGDISDQLLLRRLSKWIEEEGENLNSHIFVQKPAYLNGMRWGGFCEEIFFRYKENLPDFWNYSDAMMAAFDERLPFAQKFAFINGQIELYPGRGESKKK